jgi:LuxR family maltose regulon positive regulatory protein
MIVSYILGLTHKITGELRLASEELAKAANLGQELANVHIIAGAYGRLAGVQVTLGHLRQAEQTCRQGLKLVQEMGGPNSPLSGLIRAELGNLRYEQNDLENAQKHIQEAITVAKPWRLLEAFVPAFTGLARLRVAQGNLDGAFAALDELAEHGKSIPQMVMPAVESLRARLWVEKGQLNNAIQWVQDNDLHSDGDVSITQLNEYLVLARVLIAQGQPEQASDLLSRLLDVAEKAEWMGRVIEMLVLQALALQAKGKTDLALSSLEQALILAEPESYARTFVDEGEPMACLLRQAASRDFATEYVGRLLGEFESDASEKQSSSAQALYEPLSERELEVLRLLNTDLSGPEIASELSIAISTLRFHTRNIYSKFDVSNRRGAIRKAEELNLI